MSNVPEHMKALAIDHYGGPEVLTLHTLPVPELGADEVLIRVEVAGLGVWDILEREGQLIFGEAHFPRVLGAEGAGTVAALGHNVTRFKVGERVYGYGFQNPKGGFYAEYIALTSNAVAHVPDQLSFEEAGAMPVGTITGLCGLEELQLSEGQTLMIWGASGGLGHLVVQFAKRLGARVFAVASGADGVDFVRRLGADEAVDGHSDEVLAEIAKFAPDGLDAALILAGGAQAQAALEAVRQGGRIAFPHGVQPEPQGRPDVTVHAFDAHPNPELLERLNKLIEAGPFEVTIARTYPLENAATAHGDLKGHFLGKLALIVGN
jgi:NADPH2:quinone reductase